MIQLYNPIPTCPVARCTPATARTDPQLFHWIFITDIDVSINMGPKCKMQYIDVSLTINLFPPKALLVTQKSLLSAIQFSWCKF